MVLAVLPALITEIRKIYDAYFAAFGNDRMGEIMLRILFPHGIDSEESRAIHAANTLSWWHQSDNQLEYTYKCVDMDTGDIVGMGLVDIYLNHRTEEERKNGGVPWLTGEQRDRAEKVLNPLWEMRERLFGGQPYIYAHIIGVLPGHQGKGAGAAMALFGIDLCNRTGLPLYFEASPTSVGLYEKMGYERLKETIVLQAELLGTEEDVSVPLMIRKAPNQLPSWGQLFKLFLAKLGPNRFLSQG
ncbi:hypothetical protein VTK56DRAFT_1301 [Thermocarpiscus australiensis]